MSDHGEADLCAISREEDVFVDKKTSIANLTSQWSLMSLVETLIMLCTTFLFFLLTVLPFILRMEHPQITLGAFASSSGTSLPRTPPALTIALKSAVEEQINLFEQILCLSSTGDLPLAKKFHVVLDRLDESKLTHFLWIADVQTARVHLEEQGRETKLLAMDDKSCLNFAIICDPIDLDRVL
jgi:hypothetical protein